MKKTYIPLVLISLLCIAPKLYSAHVQRPNDKLREAIIAQQADKVRAWLEYIGLENITNPAQLLTEAINYPKILNMLLEKGIDVHTPLIPVETPTALHLAALHGNEESVEVLLKFGADETATNNRDETPKDLATDPAIKALLTSTMIKGARKR